MFKTIVDFEHFVMRFIHVDLQTVEHFVLLVHFCTEVLVLMLNVLDDAAKLIELLILIRDKLPLFFQQLLIV